MTDMTISRHYFDLMQQDAALTGRSLEDVFDEVLSNYIEEEERKLKAKKV
jgi:hypothetical protein